MIPSCCLHYLLYYEADTVTQVMVLKPMTDLCWVCQQNSATIMRSANIPEEEKSEVKLLLHLDLATKARTYLKALVTAAKETILKFYTKKDLPLLTVGACLLPASNNITMHFKFSFYKAQLVCQFL